MKKNLTRRQVGKTKCEVSVLGLGGAPLGNLFEVLPEDWALSQLPMMQEWAILIWLPNMAMELLNIGLAIFCAIKNAQALPCPLKLAAC